MSDRFIKCSLGMGAILGVLLIPSYGAVGFAVAIVSSVVAAVTTWIGLTMILGATNDDRLQAWGCAALLVGVPFIAYSAWAALTVWGPK